MNTLQMIFKYWMKSRKNFIISLIWQIIFTIISSIIPIYMGKLVGSFDPSLPEPPTPSFIWINFAIIMFLAFLGYLTNRAGRIRSAEVSTSALYHLRADISNAIYKQSFAYFDKHETGQLIARATSDVEQTQMIFGFGLATGLQAFVQLIGVIISGSLLEPRLSWIFYIAIPFSIIVTFVVISFLKPIFLETREAFGLLTNTIRENIIGASVVRIFSMQDKERKKFSENNKRFYDASVHSAKLSSLFMPFFVLTVGFMVILLLFVSGKFIINHEMELSTLVTFQSYIGLSIFPLVIFSQIMLFYVQANAAFVRIREVIESTPEIVDSPNAIPLPSHQIKGDIEFDHVSFGYTPSNMILKDISFKIPAGKKLAILGTTGSGKSTIINLLPRFYEVNKGEIRIDGRNIKDYLLKDLRMNIGVVSQETFLFNKTIGENIAFGKENATLEEIQKAAKIANLDEFIESLPEKYNTLVGERGTRLSGGQKQRLSIARAIIMKPKIIIFDDSTSSVDVETEYKIQNALDQIMHNSTTLIITQRISTFRNADEIMVLDKGRIVGLGTHDVLIKENVLYRQIYETLYQKQKIGGKA